MHRLRRYEVFEVCVQDDERSHEATATTREGFQMILDMTDPRIIRHEAAHALYNRMQKYIYAYKQRKGLIK
jgi:hypothetical protein